MINYNDLYEILRKEKYSEVLQTVPKNFVKDVSDYFGDKKVEGGAEGDLFQDSILKAMKQLENAISLFRELMLRRKKKILNLVFVAAETGIMKRDYENMLDIEKEAFEKMVKAFEECDKELSKMLRNKKDKKEVNKMILFRQSVDQYHFIYLFFIF